MKISRFACIACTLVFLLACVLPASAQIGTQINSDIAVADTQWSSYTNGNWINDLAFDADGYLWAATSGGAVRWNIAAAEYVKYTSEYGLCSNQLSAVTIAPDGTVWLASKDNGISGLKDGVFTNYTVDNGLPSNAIHDITVTPDGILWAASGWDLCSFDGQQWQTYQDTPLKDNETFAEMIVSKPDGSLWIGSHHSGVYRLSDGVWTQYRKPETLSTMVDYLALAADGSVWATLLNVDLVRYSGDQPEIVDLDMDSLMNIDCFYIEADGTMWISNWGDMIKIKGGAQERFSRDLAEDTETTCIIGGPDGTIWCGGFWGGLAGYKNGEWTVLKTDDWLPDNTVQKVVETGTGGMWILSDTAISYYDGETAQVYPTNWKAWDLLIAPDGAVWVSIGHNGVYRYDGIQWVFCGPGEVQDGFEDNSFGAFLDDMQDVMGDDFDDFMGETIGLLGDDGFGDGGEDSWLSDIDLDEGSPGVMIEPNQMQAGVQPAPWYISIALTPDGRLLCVNADETVHSYAAGLWSKYPTQSDSVSDVYISQQGAYWLSCYEGIYRSPDGSAWTLYPEIVDPASLIYHSGSLYVTPDEVCWIASLSGVGCQPAGGDSFYFQKGGGIPNENVSCVTGAPDGTIWIGTAYIASLENGAGAGYYDGSQWHLLTASDGLASNAVHNIFAGADHISFATHGGISVYRPNPTQ